MSKKLKKSAAATGTKLVASESTGATSRLLDKPEKSVTYGPFSGSAVRELRFDVKVSTSIPVPAALYEFVKLQADQNSRCLAPHAYIATEVLVGLDFWCGLSVAERDMANACVSHLCQSGALPLETSGVGLEFSETYYLPPERAEQKSKQAKAAA
jgi:hypothetical protein